MKKYTYSIISIMAMFIFLFSCNVDHVEEVYKGDSFVSFYPKDRQTINLPETEASGAEISVTISEASTSPVTVKLNLSYPYSNVVEGTDFTISSKEIVIPAGEYSGSVWIFPIDNEIYDGDDPRDIVLDIASTSGSYQIGLAEETSYKTTVNLVDNDCPLDLSAFVGNYVADENNGSYGPYTVTVALGTEPLTLMATNIFDVGATNTLTLDACPKTISFSDGEYLYTSSTYGDVGIYNTSSYTSTFNIDGSSITMDLYFKACVSAGCFTGFDGANQRVQLVKQ